MIVFLSKKIFQAINLHLRECGLILKEGTIVDTTLISAPSSIKNKDRKRDLDMSSTKKGNQWYFGIKMHIGTGLQGKPLIYSV